MVASGEKGMSSVSADKPIYHLENHKGEKLFYDSKMEAYYFKQMGEFGCGVWESEEHVRIFVREYKFEVPMIFMVKHLGRGEYEKTPIQAYGKKKNPDGTMGELEYIELKAGDVTGNPFDDTVH
jgi:hypothetical protein